MSKKEKCSHFYPWVTPVFSLFVNEPVRDKHRTKKMEALALSCSLLVALAGRAPP
ncbi:unnamed protein product [Amoebophrya sp. A120]|nr:unnamed protein product [Amoebophrya sp. A120]|eukprot:GSA120T00017296001.1